MTTLSNPCPCGSSHVYGSCCEPYCAGAAYPPTAEALMRSRYTAFSQGHIDYLIATHHPTQRTPDQRRNLAKTIETTTWLGLTVVSTQHGQQTDRTGVVEFIAYYQDINRLGQVHERSRFVKQKDRWFYVDGDQLPPVLPKRNDPCWCGSGKKYKACHGL
ncbi:MAG: YchJ family protein [Leptolyngbyaceae cyanobacterium SM2_5_2]|nr:YchJ family protein [Leptolyngbyaceae cyanobacterium SM2_5_2]